jgi:hypothetical protein
MCRSSIGWSDTHHPLISRNHMDSSNPIPSTGVFCGQTGIFKPSVFWRPTATRKTTRFGTRDAKYNAARRHAPSCMGATESQSNWPEMRKNLGNLWFCSTGFKKLTERTGTELFDFFPNFLRVAGEMLGNARENNRERHRSITQHSDQLPKS